MKVMIVMGTLKKVGKAIGLFGGILTLGVGTGLLLGKDSPLPPEDLANRATLLVYVGSAFITGFLLIPEDK